ncbi:hypothetical protein BDR03DRAFT_470604 [Suillus americanus]|nr:hypothetical protein BDR03DRAFT_470604 [Suillus americanus]
MLEKHRLMSCLIRCWSKESPRVSFPFSMRRPHILPALPFLLFVLPVNRLSPMLPLDVYRRHRDPASSTLDGRV